MAAQGQTFSAMISTFVLALEGYPESWPGWTPTTHLPHGIPALITAHPACGAKQGSLALLPLGSEDRKPEGMATPGCGGRENSPRRQRTGKEKQKH